MGRKHRNFVIGAPYHIAHRGNHKQVLFESDGDRLYYLSLLHRFSRMTGTKIAGFCLMNNHVHVVATPSSLAGLGVCIGCAHRRYSMFLNARRGTNGSNWEGRFYSAHMDGVHARNAMRYIERNPVEAGVVRHPWEWKWSTAPQHCGVGEGWRFVLGDVRGEGMDPFTWRRILGEELTEEELLHIPWASMSVHSDTQFCGVAG